MRDEIKITPEDIAIILENHRNSPDYPEISDKLIDFIEEGNDEEDLEFFLEECYENGDDYNPFTVLIAFRDLKNEIAGCA
ncbi:MAG: hypothetical protein IK034_02595 [Bacilli bacterium]|nr:hypothetical protein [Bacilli bacterium]